ncbi:glycosyltransferase family protein [Labrenzia sp. OB1]|uniref:cytidylyltransferase domain-containing protein n=1 Tax=Labrenzia sp. OB1 TaxID=1561204 RepID=UPI000837E626|nr:glycosyltransferase family protein [Labrenzia sp. OB1]
MNAGAKTRVVAIVQARMGSTRLPGKVMMHLGQKTVLAHCLERCKAIPNVDEVICATVKTPDCTPVALEAERLGVSVFRGDEKDVLSRYVGAARAARADIVLRVTSDCPVIDPQVCGAVVEALLGHNADFATNNAPPSFPHGLDVEVVRAAVLEAALRNEPTAHDREHVMPAVRRNPGLKKLNVHLPPNLAEHKLRLTLDTPDDFAFFGALESVVPGLPDRGWRELADICRATPVLSDHYGSGGAVDARQSTFAGFEQIPYPLAV